MRPRLFILMLVALTAALCAAHLVAHGPWPWELAKMWHALTDGGVRGGTLVPSG